MWPSAPLFFWERFHPIPELNEMSFYGFRAISTWRQTWKPLFQGSWLYSAGYVPEGPALTLGHVPGKAPSTLRSLRNQEPHGEESGNGAMIISIMILHFPGSRWIRWKLGSWNNCRKPYLEQKKTWHPGTFQLDSDWQQTFFFSESCLSHARHAWSKAWLLEIQHHDSSSISISLPPFLMLAPKRMRLVAWCLQRHETCAQDDHFARPFAQSRADSLEMRMPVWDSYPN